MAGAALRSTNNIVYGQQTCKHLDKTNKSPIRTTIKTYIENREIVSLNDKGIINDAEKLASKISLVKASTEYNLRRVISFHGRIKSAKEFAFEYIDLIDWKSYTFM